MNRPVFAPHYAVHRVEPDTIVLLSETQELALRGEFYYQMAPHLDGRTIPEIAQAMAGEATLDEVTQAVDILRQRGFVQEASPERPREASFWSAMGFDAEETLARLGTLHVAVTAMGDLDPEPFRAALALWGLGAGEPSHLDVVLVEDVLEAGLEEHNRQALAAGRAWLLVRPRGRKPWLGPLFIPGKTACWECLAQRQRFNRQLELGLNDGAGMRPTQAKGAVPGSLGWVAQQTALAAVRFLVSGRCAQLESQLVTHDLMTGEIESHVVIRRPQCAACGTPIPNDLEKWARLELKNTPLQTGMGGYRAFTPQETLRRYSPHVSRLTGVVSRLEQAEGTAGSPIHVFNSGYNLSRPLSKAGFILGREFRSLSSGKGKSPVEARAGALAEAIERYSSAYTGDEPTRKGSLNSLGEEALDPRLSMLFSQAQYDNREEWNKTHKGMHQIPHPFDPDVELDWSPLWSLTQQKVRYLPTGYSYYLTPKQGHRYFLADSNGNAAGTSTEDAILQGFFELVERDGVALWWYNRARRPAVDLDSFDDPYFRELKDYYHNKLGRSLWALDVTSDLGVPTMVAGSADLTSGGKILLGFGAHREASIALQRALGECNQFLSMLPSLEANTTDLDDPTKPEYGWYHRARTDTHPYVVPDPDQSVRTAADYHHDWGADGKANVEACQRLVEAQGLEFLVLNQTRADVGMPVVKVVVPGMRHFWPRYAPGRLYETPVKLGWTSTVLREEELNPDPIFW